MTGINLHRKLKGNATAQAYTFAITYRLLIYYGVRELRFAQADTQTQNCKRVCF